MGRIEGFIDGLIQLCTSSSVSVSEYERTLMRNRSVEIKGEMRYMSIDIQKVVTTAQTMGKSHTDAEARLSAITNKSKQRESELLSQLQSKNQRLKELTKAHSKIEKSFSALKSSHETKVKEIEYLHKLNGKLEESMRSKQRKVNQLNALLQQSQSRNGPVCEGQDETSSPTASIEHTILVQRYEKEVERNSLLTTRIQQLEKKLAEKEGELKISQEETDKQLKSLEQRLHSAEVKAAAAQTKFKAK